MRSMQSHRAERAVRQIVPIYTVNLVPYCGTFYLSYHGSMSLHSTKRMSYYNTFCNFSYGNSKYVCLPSTGNPVELRSVDFLLQF